MARYDEALEWYDKVLENEPDYLWALWRVGETRVMQGRYSESTATLDKAISVWGRIPALFSVLALAHGLGGGKTAANQLLEELHATAATRYVPPLSLMHAYVAIGDLETAVRYLEEAFAERSNGIVYLGICPCSDSLRPHPRVQQMIRRLGLPNGRPGRD